MGFDHCFVYLLGKWINPILSKGVTFPINFFPKSLLAHILKVEQETESLLSVVCKMWEILFYCSEECCIINFASHQSKFPILNWMLKLQVENWHQTSNYYPMATNIEVSMAKIVTVCPVLSCQGIKKHDSNITVQKFIVNQKILCSYEHSLLCSQKPAIIPYHEAAEFSPHTQFS
jgi:hypothetical protein